jgi:hypothetical protein
MKPVDVRDKHIILLMIALEMFELTPLVAFHALETARIIVECVLRSIHLFLYIFGNTCIYIYLGIL